MDEFERAITEAKSGWRRTALYHTFNAQRATVTIRLGCGREFTTRLADHPIKDVLNVHVGEEFDCPVCLKH